RARAHGRGPGLGADLRRPGRRRSARTGQRLLQLVQDHEGLLSALAGSIRLTPRTSRLMPAIAVRAQMTPPPELVDTSIIRKGENSVHAGGARSPRPAKIMRTPMTTRLGMKRLLTRLSAPERLRTTALAFRACS